MDRWFDRVECVPESVIVRESRMEWTQSGEWRDGRAERERMERERMDGRREGESMGGGEKGWRGDQRQEAGSTAV